MYGILFLLIIMLFSWHPVAEPNPGSTHFGICSGSEHSGTWKDRYIYIYIIYIYTLLGGMDGGQGKFQLWTGEVLDFIYNFTFNPALAHRHATGSSGDLFLNQPVQGFFHSPCP